ncbi:MAG: NifB/NifX family molybdenum-iron cluster-binding protein [Thioalkalispiraceae bacterium]|jgi:predicted Fe-Mo cluster-binding NifX family protein
MKIAIASESKKPDAQVSQHAARAAYYLLYDDSGTLQQVFANPGAEAERGAGPKAAHALQQLGVQIVVAGDFGDRFVAELEAAGIQHIQKEGVITDVIADLVSK